MSRHVPLLALLLAAPPALAQGGGVTAPAPQVSQLPQNLIPPTVLMELRALEAQFDLALSRDCAPERCFSKGCTYRDHGVADLARTSSLPGLGPAETLANAPPQYYLTSARCEFAHERSVPLKDVQALVRRLEQRLNKGWLQVTVTRQLLDPISASLRESPPLPPEPAPPPAPRVEPPAPPPAAVAPAPPARWDASEATRELWLALLPHFAWMIAVVLVTLSVLMLIWAGRRLGRESIEERALAAQLTSGEGAGLPRRDVTVAPPLFEALGPGDSGAPALPSGAEGASDEPFVHEQRRLWTERVAKAQMSKDEGVVSELLREWLKAGEFALLAKALSQFGDRLAGTFPSDGELAMRKVEFADYLRGLDATTLPSDADFFRALNQHAISASLMSQLDAELYRSLREEFGAAGLTRIIQKLPQRLGAVLYALLPLDTQSEVARLVPPELRVQVAGQLLTSNRVSKEERSQLFAALDAARAGLPLPSLAAPAPHDVLDRGREFEAAGALSVLFPYIDPTARQAVFEEALRKNGGAVPRWYTDILFPEMLLKLPDELRADLLLSVDVKGLAGWSSVQHPSLREAFITRLPASLQSALKGSMGFSSRADQLRLARLGHGELVAGLRRLMAQEKLSFAELLSA